MSLYGQRRLPFLISLLCLLGLGYIAHIKSYDDRAYQYVCAKSDKTANKIPDEILDKLANAHIMCQDEIARISKPFQDTAQTIVVPKGLTYDINGPKSSQIAILTGTDGKGHSRNIKNLTELAFENREIYAKHHGYIFHHIDISKYDLRDRAPVWKKLPAIVETFNLYPDVQWVFWVDADAVFMNIAQDLQSLILSEAGMQKQLIPGAKLKFENDDELDIHAPSEVDFNSIDLIIAQDWSGINAGTFFLRRSAFTQWLLDMWSDPMFMYTNFERHEQDALRHMLKYHATMRQHVGIARQRAINAYPDHQNPEIKWQTGDLLVHFAGCWFGDNNCQSLWDSFWPQRNMP